jgi:hypothetical protein
LGRFEEAYKLCEKPEQKRVLSRIIGDKTFDEALTLEPKSKALAQSKYNLAALQYVSSDSTPAQTVSKFCSHSTSPLRHQAIQLYLHQIIT